MGRFWAMGQADPVLALLGFRRKISIAGGRVHTYDLRHQARPGHPQDFLGQKDSCQWEKKLPGA